MSRQKLVDYVCWFLCGLLAVGMVAFITAPKAHARWRPEYSKLPPEVQAWYKSAELTPEAQKRIGYKGCCEHADVVEAKFNAVRIAGKLREEWWYQLDGTDEWKRIPDDIIWWGVPAPYGAATLFVYYGKETCFYPPAGGI